MVIKTEKEKITEEKAKEYLKKLEEKFPNLIENLQEGLWVLDKNENTIYVNKQMADMLGYKSEEMLGKKVFAFMDKQGIRICKQKLKSRKQGKKEQHEFEFIHKDGSRVCVLMNASSIFDKKGNYILGFATVININERKKAEEKLINQGNLLKTLSSINQDIAKEKDLNKLLQSICQTVVKETGITFAWIGTINKESYDVKPVAFAGAEKGYLKKVKIKYDNSKYGCGPTGTAIKTQKPSIMRFIESDPKYKPWRKEALKRGYKSSIALPMVFKNECLGIINFYSPAPDAFSEENIYLFFYLAGDVASAIVSLNFQKKLKESEEKFKFITQNNPDHILIQDINLRYEFVLNPQLGLTEKEMIGKTDFDILLKKDAIELTKIKKKVLNTGKASEKLTIPLYSKKGDIEYFEGSYIPRYGDNKKVTGIIGYFKNITEKKKVEEELIKKMRPLNVFQKLRLKEKRYPMNLVKN